MAGEVEGLEGAQRLAAAMIEHAVRDLQGRRGGDPAEALEWLQSSRAALWFDILDVSQAAMVSAILSRTSASIPG